MPKNIPEERYRWLKPILDQQITIKKMATICPFSERTLKYWLTRYRTAGLAGLNPHSRRPKSNPTETPVRIKERILEMRRVTRLSALKLKWKLAKEDLQIHERTIGKFIKQEGLTRKYRRKKIRYHQLKIPLRPGELVEIDIKYVPEKLHNRHYYQFTAIDCATRWRYLKVYEHESNLDAIKFLSKLISVAPFRIRAIKTDNGSCFTNYYTGYLKSTDPLNPRLHVFDLTCQHQRIIHYLIDAGKPQQNGKVERSHRTDQEMFYERANFKSLEELKYKLKLWNMYYNDLEHCALNGLTPNQALRQKVQYVLA